MWLIPRFGTEVRLLEDWVFKVHDEQRNDTLLKHLGYKPGPRKLVRVRDTSKYGWHWEHTQKAPAKCVLPGGTVLTVDRLYIRKPDAAYGNDAPDWNSLTFKFRFPGTKKVTRFWARLSDVRQMVCKEVKF